MAKKVISKHNKIQSAKTINETWDQYLNVYSQQLHPTNDGFFTRLALEIVEWAKNNKNALMISQFYNEKGFVKGTYYRWVESKPEIKVAHETAMSLIADRRELILAEKDPSSLRYVMPHYSEIWLKEDNRRAEQKKEIESEKKASDFNITLQAIPNTKEVPERKDE